MSGESVALIGVAAAGVGALALLGVAAGASCAYVAGHGLEALGSQLERQHAAREAERDAARTVLADWDRALHEVALRNGRIGVLRTALAESALAESAPASPRPLPPPLVLGTQTLAELHQWCTETDARLAQAEAGAVQQAAQAILRRAGLLAAQPDHQPSSDDPNVRAGSDGPPGARPGEELREDIVRVAGRLLVGVTAPDRESVARTAELVLTAPSRTEALNRLGDMRVRVDHANAEAELRRAQAAEAARLLQPLAHADAAAQPLRDDLLQVVAGAAALTKDLRERARQAAAELQQAADRRYVRDSVTESLAELGYAVDEGFQTAVATNGVLQVTRSEWHAHGVRLALDEEKGALRAVVVRTVADGGWDTARVDTEREAQWCSAQEKLKAILAAKSITLDVRSLTEPGTRSVPVVRDRPAPGGTATAAPRTGQS